MVGFLLVIPFSPRFEDVTMFQRDISAVYVAVVAALWYALPLQSRRRAAAARRLADPEN